ncbi:MAG: hypothetical protein K0R52_891 [Alphaproteobacteria bacterium]|jgi:hypothetical protein|nr:hypothetical protein [Alphaproteobacteria bacterium]
MDESKNKDFFLKLWKCPARRAWRYSRKFIFIALLGVLVWVALDFAAIVLMMPHNHPPFLSLVGHAFLTITLSLILTLMTHQVYLRMSSRFQLIRVFQPSRRPPHDR